MTAPAVSPSLVATCASAAASASESAPPETAARTVEPGATSRSDERTAARVRSTAGSCLTLHPSLTRDHGVRAPVSPRSGGGDGRTGTGARPGDPQMRVADLRRVRQQLRVGPHAVEPVHSDDGEDGTDEHRPL